MRFSRVKLRGRMIFCPFFLLDRLAASMFAKLFLKAWPVIGSALFG